MIKTCVSQIKFNWCVFMAQKQCLLIYSMIILITGCAINDAADSLEVNKGLNDKNKNGKSSLWGLVGWMIVFVFGVFLTQGY